MEACAADELDIVTFKSKSEAEEFRALLPGGKRFWVGYAFLNGIFQSYNDETEIKTSFFKWAAEAPIRDCVNVGPKGYYMRDCFVNLNIVCQRRSAKLAT